MSTENVNNTAENTQPQEKKQQPQVRLVKGTKKHQVRAKCVPGIYM